MSRKYIVPFLFLHFFILINAQIKTSNGGIPVRTPPMGWMSWNFFGDNLQEKDIHEIADAMVDSGMLDAGYQYVFIDDGWQGGRDSKNNIIPDSKKFPSGMKALADYVHKKGLKLGIYSDAAQLTCAGYTGSLNFEEQDAVTFASWGIDYLKYDYCNAPGDSITAKIRYKAMSEALQHSGRDIALGVCEWGQRQPWKWAAAVGGNVWRTTGDIRDKWKNIDSDFGSGILDIMDGNAELNKYAASGTWNDMDMLIVGLYGKKGPSSDLGGIGCNDIEYRTQMSIWCMMASPLATSNDVRNMNEATKRILLNKEIIKLNQDALGKQCERKVYNKTWNVFLKPLANGDCALAILNHSNVPLDFSLLFSEIGLGGKYEIRDVWAHKIIGKDKKWKGNILSHETKVLRLKKIHD
ncbi:MAG: glycoside hydrolase family 27 protein [Paludibacter sp.]|nr:glycoside hydrolase family 27 protein [Paludibacter sp.]